MARIYLNYSQEKHKFIEALSDYIDKTQAFTKLTGEELKARILNEINDLYYDFAVKSLNTFYKNFPSLLHNRNFFEVEKKVEKKM